MKPYNILILSLLFFIISCSSGVEKNNRTEFYKSLIEMLVVEKVKYDENVKIDPFDKGFVESEEKFKRIQFREAHLELTAAGREAWPALFDHLDDKRPSDAAKQVMGPYDIGHQCYYLLYYQVVNMPKGFTEVEAWRFLTTSSQISKIGY